MADYGGYTEDELVRIYKSLGWNDEAAIRGDIRAGHWPEKVRAAMGTATGATGQSTPGFDVGAVVRTIAMRPEDVAALKKLRVSEIDYNAIEKQALAELTEYYTKILEDVGWDINKARERLEEDYRRGLRTRREDAAVSLKTLLGQTFPQEQRALLDELNRRGLLTTVLPEREAPTPYTLPTGETITPTPVTTARFGGVAGAEIERGRTAQTARREAIERALRRAEEESGIERTRRLEDIAKSEERRRRELEQEKREKATALAASRYERAIRQMEAKRAEILEPYIYKAQGIEMT